jgi:hypothetical protein
MSAQRRYFGPFLASGPRSSRRPDWRTIGHSPVYPASVLGDANCPMSPSSAAIVYPSTQAMPGTVMRSGTYGRHRPI